MDKQKILRWGLVLGLGYLGACGSACPLVAADASASDLSAASENQPLNLARLDYGARLTVQAPGGAQDMNANAVASAALLSDNYAIGYSLGTGGTQMILTLPKAEILHRFDFLNQSAAGRVSISVSSVNLPAGSPRWRQVVTSRDFSAVKGVVSCELGSVEARYVRVNFDILSQGRIDTFGLFGRATVASAGRSGKLGSSEAKFLGYETPDYSNVAAQTVVYVSPGEDIGRAQAMVSGSSKTSYAFSASDRRPIVVIDLGSTRRVGHIGASFRAAPGRLDFYVVKDPNEREGLLSAGRSASAATLNETFTNGFPGDRAPAASVVTGEKPGLTRVDVRTNGQVGRYLAVVFTRSGDAGSSIGGGPRVDRGDFKDFKGAVPYGEELPPGTPLELGEVTAFGPPPGALTPDLLPPNPAVNPPGSLPPNSPPEFHGPSGQVSQFDCLMKVDRRTS